MVNIKTPANTFCKQFFTIFYVIYCVARNSLTRIPIASPTESKLSLYLVFHHKIINFSLRAKGIFLAVFWIQKALGILALKTHLSPQHLHFFAAFRISFKNIRITNCFKKLNGFVIFAKYCRNAEIKKRGTLLIDHIKNQN